MPQSAMSAPNEPPSAASSAGAHEPPAPRVGGRGRRLRARRVAPPLRLIEHGDGGSVATTAARLDLQGPGPLALMRLGRSDLEAGMRAVRAGARPTAVVTAL